MDFRRTPEQQGFAQSLTNLMSAADPVAAARSWAAGDHEAGLALWARLAEQGVNALVVPEEHGGMGGSPADLVVAFEVLGHHLAVGPWIESVAYLPRALTDAETLGNLAEGLVATVACPPVTPYALDADVAERVYAGSTLVSGPNGDPLRSVDTTRRLFKITPEGGSDGAGDASAVPAALDLAALACAAQLLGCGERLLADTVAYVKQRRQYGREIGSYQAIKHQLADVRIALDFARPLVEGAALTIDSGDQDAHRSVSAAKIAASEAAYLASREGLQLHGAIGYTAEFDLGLWINRVRALIGAWGDPSYHRARVGAVLAGVAEEA